MFAPFREATPRLAAFSRRVPSGQRPATPVLSGGTLARLYHAATRSWPLLSLMLLVLVAYGNSLRTPFILDNADIVLQDPRVHAVTAFQLQRILTQQYWETSTTGLYRPLTTLSYLFNYAILGNGADPEGYHWINLVLHLLNTLLVYSMAKALFRGRLPGLITAALWALHPVHTEAVTNIVGRADLLVTFGALAALVCHRRAIASGGLRKEAWLAAMLCAAVLSAFSKESGVVILGLLPLWDLTVARDRPWRSRLPSYLMVLVPCAAYLAVRAAVLRGAPVLATNYCDNPLLGAGFWSARLTALKVVGHDLLLLLWPAHLSYDYSYNQIPLITPRPVAVIVALLSVMALVVLAVWTFRRHPIVFFGLGFAAIAFAPTSNLLVLIGSIMAERFLYLPSIGLALCVACTWRWWWQHFPVTAHRSAAAAVLGMTLLAYTARTEERNNDWDDPHRFWQSGAEVAAQSYKTHLNVATTTAFLVAGDWDIAINESERALAILDGLPPEKSVGRAYRDAAMIFREVGEQLASGKFAGTRAAGTTPSTWYQKALAAALRSEAIELAFDARYRAENAALGRPGLTAMPSKLYLEMGRDYLRLGRRAEAVAAFERGLALEALPELLEEAAAAYENAGDLQHAIIALEESYTVDAHRPVLGKLARLYTRLDPGGCAVTAGEGGSALNPDCPRVHADICAASRNIANTYDHRGQPLEAAQVRKRGIEYLGCAPELLR